MLAMQHYNASPTPLSNQSHGTAKVAAVAQNVTATRNPTMAVMSMTLGILSNILALFILAKAYNRMRRRSKATFLLFASSLVATDLAGHIISGALVLRHYSTLNSEDNSRSFDSACQFLGGCMVFFGLCPLFMGCAMAAERCLGVTRPLLHASWVSTARTKLALSFIWLMALFVALLPSFNLGRYTYQHPKTWCFISVLEGTQTSDVAFVLIFSGLGMASLAVALVCNTISGITLVCARLRRKTSSRRSTRSHDIEMVVQLLGIMITSCICWVPLLVSRGMHRDDQITFQSSHSFLPFYCILSLLHTYTHLNIFHTQHTYIVVILKTLKNYRLVNLLPNIICWQLGFFRHVFPIMHEFRPVWS